jgi:LAGLIDADG endonuclease
MDADGSFQIFPKKRSYISTKSGIVSEYINIGYGIHISLSDRDLPLLKEINQHLSNLVNPKIHNNFKLSGKIYTYPKRKEAVLAYTKLLDIQFLIENVFDKYPLVTLNQRQRYKLLRTGILNKIKRLDNLEEYKKFKIENSVVTDYNYWKESESKNLREPVFIKQGSSVDFEDS